MPFEISLKGKTVLVTGGARGIGAEICRRMAKADADIVINYYDCPADREAIKKLEAEIISYGVKVLSCCADVSDENEVEAMVRRINDKFGGVDVLVNNAGLTITAKLHEMTTAQWRKMTGVILDGTFFVTRAVLPFMLKKNKGSVIMISTNCTVNGGGGSAAYPAAKSGMEGIVKQLTYDYASMGLRANIIRPAVIDTELLRQRYPADEQIAQYGKALPAGHVGKPADIANIAVFLASDEAEYICGESILADGGRTYYKK